MPGQHQKIGSNAGFLTQTQDVVLRRPALLTHAQEAAAHRPASLYLLVMSVRSTLGMALLGALLVTSVRDGDARGKRRGKVVRVERTRLAGVGKPRTCGNVRPDAATCYGSPPEVDEIGTVVDDTGQKGTVRVLSVTPMPDGCGNSVSWEIQTAPQSGDLSAATYTWALLFDVDTTTRTRVMYNNGNIPVPSNRPGENLWYAFDHDTDDIADFMITYYSCDATGGPLPSSSGYCMVYYGREEVGYLEQRVDIVRNCN